MMRQPRWSSKREQVVKSERLTLHFIFLLSLHTAMHRVTYASTLGEKRSLGLSRVFACSTVASCQCDPQQSEQVALTRDTRKVYKIK